MPAIIQIELPTETVEQLEEVARQQQRTVDEVVRGMILQELPSLPPLPEDVEAELAAFDQLSDDVLWILASSTITEAQREELARLNEEGRERDLTSEERDQQEVLLDAYNRMIVRRSQAAALLKERGHDIQRLRNSYRG